MSEIPLINWREIKFTRDTEINYQKENIVIQTIFGKYDINKNGNLRDSGEFEAYEKAMQRAEQREENKVTAHYDKKLEKIYKDYEKLGKKFDTKESAELKEIFDKLLKFEEENKLERQGYFEKSEKPENEKSWDVSAFCMGDPSVLDKDGRVKVYKKGYILGFDKLDETKQKEYLELFNRYSKLAKKFTKYYKEYENIDKEHERYLGLKDMAAAGLLNPKRVGSKLYEDQAYQMYITAKSQNPFERQIKDLEQKRQALYAKKENATKEDYQQIEQYNIQIQQLRNASSQWSIADTEITEKIKNAGFNINSITESVTYSESNPNEETKPSNKVITDTHSINMGYSNENINVSANIDNTQTYTIDPESKFENSWNTYVSAEYARGNSNIGTSSNINISENMFSYTQGLNFGYNDLRIDLTNQRITTNTQNTNENGEIKTEKSTTNSGNVTLSHSIGSFNNSVGVDFEGDEKTYSLNSSASFNPQLNKNWQLSIQPSFGARLSQEAQSKTISPSINTEITYNNNKGFSTRLNISEQYSKTFAETKIEPQNTLTLSANATYNKVSCDLKYTNVSDSNTFGAKLNYRTKKAGTYTLEGSIQKGYDKNLKKDTYSNKLVFTYTAPLDWIKKKDKKD